jgi:hypothetical protein
MTGTLREGVFTCMITSRSVILVIRNASDNNIARRMRFAWWINKTTYTCFSQQQWFREGASRLRSTCIAYLVNVEAEWGSLAENLHQLLYLRRKNALYQSDWRLEMMFQKRSGGCLRKILSSPFGIRTPNIRFDSNNTILVRAQKVYRVRIVA